MIDGPYSIKRVVREIECDTAYLEDAPEENLEPFLENLENAGKRLLKLKEYLSSRMGRVNG